MVHIIKCYVKYIFYIIRFSTGISLCNQHCGCIARRRRSTPNHIAPFGFLMIDNNESDDIQSLEFLALAMIEVVEDVPIIERSSKDSSNQLSVIENPARLRRSVDLENLNQLYSSVTERLDEIGDLFEGTVLKRQAN